MTFPIHPSAWPAKRLGLMLGLAATLLLAACGSTPKVDGRPARASPPAPSAERDGPEANPPPNLHQVPDAEPKVEALRVGGPNKPYEVLGQQYTPMTRDEPVLERGLASWYGRKFQGRRTASGEVYNMYLMTAAHPTFPIPSYARVRNPSNDREVIVRINDRGPFKGGRVIDVSYTAALKLGILGGVTTVEVERITHEAIRSGSWRRASQPGEPPSAGPGDGIPVAVATPVDAPRPVAILPAPVLIPLSNDPPAVRPAEAPAREPEWGDRLDTAPGASTVTPTATTAQPRRDAAPDATPAIVANTQVLPTERAGTQAARGWWLQLGAFKAADGAAQFQRKVAGDAEWVAPLLAQFHESALHKLQAGPFPSRDEALAASQRLRGELRLVPMLVERR